MIFYFSGTGNTAWLARQVAQATGEQLVSIADSLHGDGRYGLQSDERIGVFFPVHGWRPPFIVRDFVRNLRIEQGPDNYCYAFATCGDDVGLTFDVIADDLRLAGLRLDSVFSLIMPESYVFPMVDMIDTSAQAKQKLAAAESHLRQLLPHIMKRDRGLKEINASRWPRINSRLLGSYFLRHWVTDRKFRVDADACVRCGLCERVCPVDNIQSTADGQPQWTHNGLCTTCFACYHHCPVHAIGFGSRTKGKRQYYYGKND